MSEEVVAVQERIEIVTEGVQGPTGPTGATGPTGPQGPAGVDGEDDKNYVHNQISASSTWNVAHNLGKYPSVMVVDSGGSVVVGDIVHVDVNNLTVTFSAPFGGKAYVN